MDTNCSSITDHLLSVVTRYDGEGETGEGGEGETGGRMRVCVTWLCSEFSQTTCRLYNLSDTGLEHVLKWPDEDRF